MVQTLSWQVSENFDVDTDLAKNTALAKKLYWVIANNNLRAEGDRFAVSD